MLSWLEFGSCSYIIVQQMLVQYVCFAVELTFELWGLVEHLHMVHI